MKRVVGYGEAMLRYIVGTMTKVEASRQLPRGCCEPSLAMSFNVMVALAKLGGDVQGHFITVLPDSNHGASIIEKRAEDAGVSMRGSVRVSAPNMLGTFTVLPHERRVEYQRSASAFWQSDAHRNIDWQAVLSGASWLHAFICITPMCGKHATKSVDRARRDCSRHGCVRELRSQSPPCPRQAYRSMVAWWAHLYRGAGFVFLS